MTRQMSGLVTFLLERASIDRGVGEPISCLRCEGGLGLTQPDPDDPDRLIGTCGACGSWFLIRQVGEGPLLDVLALPGPGTPEDRGLPRLWSAQEAESIQVRA
ncbi:hypothetical protein [Tautonia plasticadhaerens]|uniref:Uncharacterized protein n=1 Tax=Tautonia plasticadhaerens TaxID=2527974 RepID=A0A518GY50_9BACT|nr:hypothetical protein [Tautonia plasticadhaerens]QDV33519.1 hypothetical protein ElP_13920 [Tautonia plasticadhaerens]